ncbi:MAG: glycosyltransferase family 4 protein [Lachnospiraceae bacterium]|nr:glycosyltransferase family 4 protein [Lachnospiraceae bacterium]
MKIYVDVTNLMNVDFLTGIQRVVREVVIRMIKDPRLNTVLLSGNHITDPFTVLNNRKFTEYFVAGTCKKSEINTALRLRIKDMTPGSVFFDIDATFHSRKRRSALLPQLKSRGIRIAQFSHDIIPLLHPETVNVTTMRLWMDHFAAHMKYDDLIITSVKESVNRLKELNSRFGLPEKKIVNSWLGNDFIGSETGDYPISDEIKNVEHKGRYVIMVGTIEPRKNHKVILDAFDKKLFDRGLNLVLVGRMGWDVEELAERINNHPLLGKKLFLLSGVNDADLNDLYSHAYLMAFPSYMEGFGLPIVEALSHKTPVVSSNEAAIREVLGEYGESFDPDDPDEFIRIVESYLDDPEKYKAIKEKVASYVPVSWDEVAATMTEHLLSLEPDMRHVDRDTHIKQLVMISAREEDLLATLPYIEHFMPFIKELVLCCPERMVQPMKDSYCGRLEIKYLTDDMVLNGEELPEDHGERNTFLRFCIMQQDVLDDVFIMGDDDGRPLQMISEDFYIKDGRYQAYYYYDGSEWWGTQGNPTSFDLLQSRYFDFAVDNGYPTYLFGSHMPQVIDRRIYNEIRERFPGIEHAAYCEWALYFNYVLYNYPGMIDVKLFNTLNWPGNAFDWNLYEYPERFIFENYYEHVYRSQLFRNIDDTFGPETTRDNVLKIIKRQRATERRRTGIKVYDKFCRTYARERGEYPVMCIDGRNNALVIYASSTIRMLAGDNLRMPIDLITDKDRQHDDLQLNYRFYDPEAERFTRYGTIRNASFSDGMMEMQFLAPPKRGRYILTIHAESGKKFVELDIDAEVVYWTTDDMTDSLGNLME